MQSYMLACNKYSDVAEGTDMVKGSSGCGENLAAGWHKAPCLCDAQASVEVKPETASKRGDG